MTEELKQELVSTLQAALEWIDAVPTNTRLPAMPGFDRDMADALIERALTQRPAAQAGEREAFEAWTETQPHGKYPLRRDQEGQYWADGTEVAWDAWQARASLPTQPAQAAQVPDVDDLRDRLVAISAAVADIDGRAAQSMLGEILRMLAAAQAKGGAA